MPSKPSRVDEWARLLHAIEPDDENTNSSSGSFVLDFPDRPRVIWDSLTGAFKRPEPQQRKELA